MTENNQSGPPPYANYASSGNGPIVQVQVGPNVGPDPVNTICPQCKSPILTEVDAQPSGTAWVLGILLCMCGCICCACIPCCTMQDVNHTCPKCGAFIGRYKS